MRFGRRNAEFDKLRPLAGRKGSVVTTALTKGLYYLTDIKTDKRATAPNETPVFTPMEALRFLTTLKDRNPPKRNGRSRND